MSCRCIQEQMAKLSVFLLFVLSINRAVVFVVGLERCSDFTGGGFCPTSNTCCRLPSGASGCIPADLGAYNATCCNDGTGCGVGYDCGPQNTCVAKPDYTDPLVQTLPRYPLCQAPPHLQEIYGFVGRNNNDDKSPSSLSDDNLIIRPAYYSSMGSLESLAHHNKSDAIRHVIFVIHGSGRNADDYYCTMYSAVMKQQHHHHDDNQVLVIAPRFASMSDEAFALHNNAGIPMRWDEGAWRYGAEAVNNPNVSSFQVLDDMVNFVRQALATKNLHRITVIGHSAGGQFVQRWALLTQVWTTTTTTRKQHQHQPAMMRAIVVNPSSYCYLTPLRTSTSRQEWVLPDVTACPAYNDWEWGLATTTAPRYVQRVLQELSVTVITRRFAQRDVVYLAGDRDICNVPGMNKQGWCYSHGLETTCMDKWQGYNRLERHMHYFESLERIVNVTTHRRALVPGVGHDHSLIFHSPATARYLFDNDKTNNHVQNSTMTSLHTEQG